MLDILWHLVLVVGVVRANDPAVIAQNGVRFVAGKGRGNELVQVIGRGGKPINLAWRSSAALMRASAVQLISRFTSFWVIFYE